MVSRVRWVGRNSADAGRYLGVIDVFSHQAVPATNHLSQTFSAERQIPPLLPFSPPSIWDIQDQSRPSSHLEAHLKCFVCYSWMWIWCLLCLLLFFVNIVVNILIIIFCTTWEPTRHCWWSAGLRRSRGRTVPCPTGSATRLITKLGTTLSVDTGEEPN